MRRRSDLPDRLRSGRQGAGQRGALHWERHRPDRIGHSGGDGGRQERAHRRIPGGDLQHPGPLSRVGPAAVHLHDRVVLQQLRPARIHGTPVAGRPGVHARSPAQARRVERKRDGARREHHDRSQLGAHRRQRRGARHQNPPGERAADVAVDAAGPRLVELRHRHVAGRAILGPRGRTERHPL